jgi:hypothetical protein
MTEEANLTIFRDCLSETIVARADASEVAISKISRAEKKRLRKQSIHDHDMHIVRAVESSAKTNSSEDMADFVEVLECSTTSARLMVSLADMHNRK